MFFTQAPYFGEDDNRVCLAAGVITRDDEIVCPLDELGRFVDPVTDFVGKYSKNFKFPDIYYFSSISITG